MPKATPTFAEAQAYGYEVHQGTLNQGDLADLWWWTLSRPGWSSVETSEGEFATREEAEQDACLALVSEAERGLL